MEMQEYSFRREMESIDRWIRELAMTRKTEPAIKARTTELRENAE